MPLLLHPGVCVRYGVEELLFSSARQLGVPDASVVMGPIIRPVLRRPLAVLERELSADGTGADGGVSAHTFALEVRACTLAPLSRRMLTAEVAKVQRRASGGGGGASGIDVGDADSSSDDSGESSDDDVFWAGSVASGGAAAWTDGGAAGAPGGVGDGSGVAAAAAGHLHGHVTGARAGATGSGERGTALRARRTAHKLGLLQSFIRTIASSARSTHHRPRFVRRFSRGIPTIASASRAARAASQAELPDGAVAVGAVGDDVSSGARGSRRLHSQSRSSMASLADASVFPSLGRRACGACAVPAAAAPAPFPYTPAQVRNQLVLLFPWRASHLSSLTPAPRSTAPLVLVSHCCARRRWRTCLYGKSVYQTSGLWRSSRRYRATRTD